MSIGNTNFRSFDHQGGVLVYVTAHKGGNLIQEIDNLVVDQKTGEISLPAFLSGTTKEKMPSHFTLKVAHHKDDKRVIIAQREQGDRYRMSATVTHQEDLVVYSEPPCEVRFRDVPADEQRAQGIGPVAVWLDTQMQTRHGSNRADVIRVTEDGKVILRRKVLIYLDGFRIISEVGGKWQIHLRKSKSTYQLKSEDKRIESAFHGNDQVRELMRKYVFVPDFGYPSIEQFLQMLLLPKFQELVQSSKGLEQWDDEEHFWVKPEPKVAMTDGQGMIQWYVHGTGGAAMGYVQLHKPVEFKGRTITSAQLRHHSVDARTDAQGLKILRPGDIVRVHKLVDMNVGKQKFNPLAFVGVIYEHREEGEEPVDDDEMAAA